MKIFCSAFKILHELLVIIGESAAPLWQFVQAGCSRSPSGITRHKEPEPIMSINKQSDIAANMQIGPTDQGMV